jgi:hypothetical protein
MSDRVAPVGRVRSTNPQRRRSGASRTPTPREPRPGRFFADSHKRLLQLGSVAAALGSVLALALTVGDRVSGLFEDNGTVRVRIDRVKLETLPLRTYLVTKEGHRLNERMGYSETELESDVLVANVDARYEHSSRGVEFPARLILQARRGSTGRVMAAEAPLDARYVLEDGSDQCGCHEFFFIPSRGRQYRVEVQILRPNSPGSTPLDENASDWLSI